MSQTKPIESQIKTDQNVIDWSREYLAHEGLAYVGPDPLEHAVVDRQVKWAADYLDDNLPVIDDQITVDKNEVDQFIKNVGKQRDQISSGHLTQSAATNWAEEFVEFATDDKSKYVVNNNETYKQDFWKKLEDEWKVILFQNIYVLN